MVWHRTLPGEQYWEWVSWVRHTVLIITPTKPPEPCIELQAGVVALFRYPARCLTHKCPGHPNKGPFYMALHAPHALPSELSPALQTHLQEHFWGTPTKPPR